MRVDVLDHGYIEVVEGWGSDERIIEAARMSTAKGFQGWGDASAPGDERLLRYLWAHGHQTPFEMGGLIVEVQAPIFVFREWHRHRTQSYNELSARYAPMPDLFYVPSLDRMANAKQSASNKQGSEGAAWSTSDLQEFRTDIERHSAASRALYERFLASGVAREVARVVLPVNQYSRMRASANLRNWLAFLTLRMASNAQWEIRQYANALGDIVAERFPRTWALFTEKS